MTYTYITQHIYDEYLFIYKKYVDLRMIVGRDPEGV